jgi:hypothetical protein
MKAEVFIDYLENPAKLDVHAITAFEEILNEYPFCQPAQLLYLKGLQNGESIRFNRQLKIAAIYAGDRRKLFELINITKRIDSPQQTEPVTAVPIPSFEPLRVFPKEDSSSVPEKSDLIRQVENMLPIAEMDLLPFDFPAYNEEGLPEMPAEKKVPEMVTEDRKNDDLLKQFLDSDPLSKQLLAPRPVRSMGASSENLFLDIPVHKKMPGDDLIDRFIGDTSPRVMRPDQAPVYDKDVSVSSLKDDDEFLTETLARIYVQQGYFLKAIQAFEKLSLKFPEKSIYFASQIEMVRELIKNQ